jgi:hypothetical protein
MVRTMRRYIASLCALAALTAALGCQHVGGKCDCGYNPNDYPITGPTAQYPAAPVGVPVAPAKDKADPKLMPPGKQ